MVSKRRLTNLTKLSTLPPTSESRSTRKHSDRIVYKSNKSEEARNQTKNRSFSQQVDIFDDQHSSLLSPVPMIQSDLRGSGVEAGCEAGLPEDISAGGSEMRRSEDFAVRKK